MIGPVRYYELVGGAADCRRLVWCSVTCVCTRSRGASHLHLLFLEDAPRDMSMKSFVESQEGKVAVVTCTVDSNPPSELSLHQDDEVLAVGTGLDPRRRVASSLNSLRLQIKDVGLADEGHYECVAHSALGQARASLDFTVESEWHTQAGSPSPTKGLQGGGLGADPTSCSADQGAESVEPAAHGPRAIVWW